MIEQKKLYSILDANFNRAREGLRVIEDTSRFILKDYNTFIKIRNIRTKLTNIVKEIYPKLIKSRDSKKDLGRKILFRKHKNLQELVIANFSRIEQAIRVLEEYARLISDNAAIQFKNIRYKVYDLEKKVIELL